MKQDVIALVFGGRSAEHEISLRSAQAIHHALTTLGYPVHCIGIDRAGLWHYQGDGAAFPGMVDVMAPSVYIRPGSRLLGYDAGAPTLKEIQIDLLFPVLHGRWGEDGTVQGLAALCGLPCVGSGVAGSAVSMDKDFTKRLLRDAGIPVTPWLTARVMPHWSKVVATLGDVVFVKPASSGSSIGVSRVTSAEEYAQAFAAASRFDTKVIVEAEVCGREIECGILEVDGRLIASELGEIIPLGKRHFYDYDAKYVDDFGARLCVPCRLPTKIGSQIQGLSRQAFECLGLEGLARVDFFLRKDGTVVINEVNTLPGFTSISMYPKMFECSGYSLNNLIGQLVRGALNVKDECPS